uniref:Uncharacterized protein n=1 Tax=Rhizophora mucronata TaxID=61149 RepID=A0A2P2QL68_RHIMU
MDPPKQSCFKSDRSPNKQIEDLFFKKNLNK